METTTPKKSRSPRVDTAGSCTPQHRITSSETNIFRQNPHFEIRSMSEVSDLVDYGAQDACRPGNFIVIWIN